MTNSLDHHEAWLAAHYALGKLEVKQGFTLASPERSQFLRDYIEDYLCSKSLKDDSGKIDP
jgi:hypothetical protein